jgi:N6-adenosine-specific RNA methylase IME4
MICSTRRTGSKRNTATGSLGQEAFALPWIQGQLGLTAPVQRYRIVLADPPWRYDHCRSNCRKVERWYPTLTGEQIAAMPVQDIVTRDALLYLWVTAPKLRVGMDVLEAWGFAYVTGAIWDKEIIGKGYHFRGQHEHILVGKRGRPGTPARADLMSSVIRARRTAHSRKPGAAYELIERAHPQASKIELFARARRPGWAAWGDEVPSDVVFPDPAGHDPQLVLAI